MTKYVDLNGITYYDQLLKRYIGTKEVRSSDNTINVTLGQITENDGLTTVIPTDLSVNIDGETIIKNPNGKLSLANEALTQYLVNPPLFLDDSEFPNTREISLNTVPSQICTINDKLALNIKIHKQTIPSAENIYEEYILQDANGNNLNSGDSIKIYKESSLEDVQLGHVGAIVDQDTGVITDGAVTNKDALIFVYRLKTGKYQGVMVDLGMFLNESEFKDGLQTSADSSGEKTVSIKIDNTSDKDSSNNSYISVSQNGLKLSGINTAISGALSTLGSTQAQSGKYVSAIGVSNGQLTTTLENLPTLSKVASGNANADSNYFETYITGNTTSGYSIAGHLTTQSVSTAAANSDGLATALDVKTYVDTEIGQIEIESITNQEINNLF